MVDRYPKLWQGEFRNLLLYHAYYLCSQHSGSDNTEYEYAKCHVELVSVRELERQALRALHARHSPELVVLILSVLWVIQNLRMIERSPSGNDWATSSILEPGEALDRRRFERFLDGRAIDVPFVAALCEAFIDLFITFNFVEILRIVYEPNGRPNRSMQQYF